MSHTHKSESTAKAPITGPPAVPTAHTTFIIISHLGLNSAGIRSDVTTSARAVDAPPPAPWSALPINSMIALGAMPQIMHPTTARETEARSKGFRPQMKEIETKSG